VSNLWCDTWHC